MRIPKIRRGRGTFRAEMLRRVSALENNLLWLEHEQMPALTNEVLKLSELAGIGPKVEPETDGEPLIPRAEVNPYRAMTDDELVMGAEPTPEHYRKAAGEDV